MRVRDRPDWPIVAHCTRRRLGAGHLTSIACASKAVAPSGGVSLAKLRLDETRAKPRVDEKQESPDCDGVADDALQDRWPVRERRWQCKELGGRLLSSNL